MSAGALDLPAEYVRLGLRFDRLEPGFVDAHLHYPQVQGAALPIPLPPAGLAE